MAGNAFVDILKDFPTGQQLEGVFVVTNIDFVPFKQKVGKFLTCTLTDRTGTVKGIIWEDEVVKFKNDDVIKVRGSIGRFNGQLQIVIEEYSIETTFNPTEFVKTLPKEELSKLREQFTETQKLITEPLYQKLWEYCLYDRGFWSCPGGRGIHHAYIHGLVHHTMEMMSIAKIMIRQYNLDAQLLLTGILVHDIGKTWAYKWGTKLEMTTIGKLVNHTTLGVAIVCDLILGNMEDEKMLRILHMIESHHGQFGTVKPLFPEAAVLAQLDNISATVDHINGFIETESVAEWTQYDKLNQCSYFIGKQEE